MNTARFKSKLVNLLQMNLEVLLHPLHISQQIFNPFSGHVGDKDPLSRKRLPAKDSDFKASGINAIGHAKKNFLHLTAQPFSIY